MPHPNFRISLFPTTTHWSNSSSGEKILNIPIRGWVHCSNESSMARSMLLSVSKRLLSPVRPDFSKESDDIFQERFGAFLDRGVTEKGVVRVVVLGLMKAMTGSSGVEQVDNDCQLSQVASLEDIEALVCGKEIECWPCLSSSSGMFDESIQIPESAFAKLSVKLDDNESKYVNDCIKVIAYKAKGYQAGIFATTTATIISELGISIITDLDDIIKDSDVYRGASAALNNAFFTPQTNAIEGMADLFKIFKINGNAAFHYVSASPYQLIETISEFLKGNGFPEGSVMLRNILKQRSRRTYKDDMIKYLFDTYPERKFILIGDAGEKDAEVYAKFMKSYPNRILKILIRDVANGAETQKLQAVSEAFANIPPQFYSVFSDPKSLHEFARTI